MHSPCLDIPKDQYIKVGSINTRYWLAGDSLRGSQAEPKPTVLLVHGGNASVEHWLYNINVLAQHYRVYAFDMVGSGRSDKPSGSYSLTYQAQFIKDFIDVLKLERVTLIGHSMGGGAALQFALTFPQRLERLVLVASLGLGRQIAFGLRLAAVPFVVRSLRPTRRMLTSLVKQNFYDPTRIPPGWIELRYPLFALPDRKKALAQLAKTNLNLFGVRPSVYRSIMGQLSSITTPTLIIWGKQDPILPVAHAYVAAQQLPNSQLHILDSCGHQPYLECPEVFNQLVLEFLDRAIRL